MEGEDKSKKVAKEKRSVKKPKLVAPAAKEIPAARAEETLSVRKSTGAGTAKSPVRSSRTKELTYEVEVGEPGKTLYVIGHGGFLEFLWGFSIIMMMMAVAIDAYG
jgi:hypothetical protein